MYRDASAKFGLFKTFWNPADTGVDAPIPLPNVSSKILAKVIEYCRYHVDAAKTTDDKPAVGEEDVKTWDAEFVKVEQSVLFDLILVSADVELHFSKSLPFVDQSCTTKLYEDVSYLRVLAISALNENIWMTRIQRRLVSFGSLRI